MTDKDSKEREALRNIGEEQTFEAWFKVDCPVEGANAKIAAKAAWKARASISITGFDAADMATAWSNGFRDGVASLAASAGSEPVATVFTMEALAPGGGVKYHATVHKPLPAGTKLYLHPSPPEGMVGGWMPIETAPKGKLVLLWSSFKRGEPFIGDWADYMRCNQPRFTHWSRWIPTPPTTSAGSGKGE